MAAKVAVAEKRNEPAINNVVNQFIFMANVLSFWIGRTGGQNVHAFLRGQRRRPFCSQSRQTITSASWTM
jgi:hypothetical protein